MKRVTYFHPSATRTVISVTGLLLLFCCCASSAFATLSISSLSPTSGAVGASVTISGSGFGSSQGSSTVKFNGITATATSWKNTTIVATVPAGATTGTVVVTVGSNSSNGVTFTVVPPPSITSLSPPSAAIGASITIAGSNFGSTQGLGTVKFNGTTATVTSWGATSIVATVPSGATTGNVVVFASGVNSNGVTLTVVPAPSISTLSPSSGIVGTPVTITGTNFGATQGTGTVTFSGVSAAVTSWSATSIQSIVPLTAGSGNVIVFASGVNSNAKTFAVTPQITTLWGNSAIIGAKIVIQGAGFGSAQGTVTFFSNKTATISAWGPNYITAVVPSGASTGNLTVTVGGATSNGVLFTPASAPSINSISPNSGMPSSPVVITGSFFGALMQDSLVGFTGSSGPVYARPTSWSSTRIATPVPYNVVAGPVTVIVSNISSNGVTFTPNYNAVIAGTVTRSIDGSPVVGAQVQAVQNFEQLSYSATTATDGSYSLTVPAEHYYWDMNNSPYDVTAYINGNVVAKRIGVLPTAAATATVNLVVSVATISKVSPSSGPVGTTVTISGTNFGLNQGNSAITFNGTPTTPTSWGNTIIVVPVPAGATTGPIVITQPTQTSNTVTFTVGIGTIAGTITNAGGGAAISGATVQVLQSNAVQGTATSASDGTYSISSLTPGTYDIRITASGFGTSILSGNAVSAGSQTTVNASLSGPGTISGKVTQSDGFTPIVGAAVVATQTGETSGSATTDSTGNYSISTLTAGNYLVQASASGFNPQTQNGVAVTTNGTSTVNLSLAGQKTISYFYDPAGRLVGVSDSSGSTATYNYDPVGNLLSIGNNASSQVSIIGFDPLGGAAGAQVSIGGTGFSPTIGQDTLNFNGTPAAITAASATQLVAVVPTGATTGPVTVTAPGGSATSATAFTIGSANPNAPTISNLSPTIGAAGTVVTISGTNFDPAPANDLTLINRLARATISSATPSSLSTTIPTTATTGYVSVATSSGKAVSNSYLFVVPNGYTPSQVADTGSLALQSPTSLNFSAASQISLRAFDGTAGQRVVFYIAPGSGTDALQAVVLSPTNRQVASFCACGSSNNVPSYSQVVTLPTTGAYTVLTQLTTAGASKSGTIAFYDVSPDLTANITPGGPPVTVSLSSVGQSARITFQGTLGQRVSLVTSNSSFSLAPGGSISGPNLNQGFGATPGLDTEPPITLSQSGTYTILLQTITSNGFGGYNATTGSITLTLYSVPGDLNGTVSINGPALPLVITGPGQNASITFSGTAGQSVTVQLTNRNICGVWAKLFQPGVVNPPLAAGYGYGCAGDFNIPSQTLPSTGTYTILVDPEYAATGNISVAVTSP